MLTNACTVRCPLLSNKLSPPKMHVDSSFVYKCLSNNFALAAAEVVLTNAMQQIW